MIACLRQLSASSKSRLLLTQDQVANSVRPSRAEALSTRSRGAEKVKHKTRQVILSWLVPVTCILGACNTVPERPPIAESDGLVRASSGGGTRGGSDTQGRQPVNQPVGIYPYPEGGALLGQGWDTFNGNGTTGSCVRVEAAKLERSSYTMEVEQIISSYSLIKRVESSVSASYKSGGASAKASVSQSRSSSVKADDQNILFRFESLDGSTFAVGPNSTRSALKFDSQAWKDLVTLARTNERALEAAIDRPVEFGGAMIRLTDEAAALLKKDREEFRRKCGEGFVAAIHRGVRVHLLLTQSNASRDERNALTAALSASGFGASGRATYSQSRVAVSSIAKLGYKVMQDGGAPIQPVLIRANGDQLPDFSSLLPKPEQLLANPTAFRIMVVPYSNVDSRAADSLPSPLDLFTISDYYIALKDVYNLARDVAAAYKVNAEGGTGEWTGFSAPLMNAYGGLAHLERLSDEILRDLAFLETVLERCYDTKTDCSVRDAVARAGESVRSAVDESINVFAKEASGVREVASDVQEAVRGDSQAMAVLLAKRAEAKRVSRTVDEQVKFAETSERLQSIATLKRLAESSEDGELSLGFFLRFYWYLLQIPVPSHVLAPNFTVPSAGEVQSRMRAINSSIGDAVMLFRLSPWKAFFCEQQKREQLCVPDEWLRELASQQSVRVDEKSIVVIVPPPAPKPKKKCRWPKCWR